jgi:hemoglobin
VVFSVEYSWYFALKARTRFRAATLPISHTMFARYGGLAFVSRLVLRFYDRVLASARLHPYFAETDMQRLVEHQAKFIASVMGEPECYTGAMIKEAHAHLDIDEGAFDEMIGLLRLTLEDFQIASADVSMIVAGLNAHRAQIVARRAGAVDAQPA